MKTLSIKPDGWPCTLLECPPGFFVYEDSLCFKTEYDQDIVEAYCESGETFCKEKTTIVQPVEAVWIEND